jgi:Flp pilus assembly protein TadG
MGLLVWLVRQGPPRKKRAVRYANPGLVGYYWDGGAPKQHVVGNISSTGAFVYAKELWCVGTIVTVTLQRDGDGERMNAVSSITLPCRVVRHGEDGIGFNFVFQREEERKALRRFMRNTAKLGNAGAEQGQALVEFVAVIPMLFLLIALSFNFGTWLYGWVAVGNAARAAGDYAILSGSSAGLPPTATTTGLQAVINTDLTHLPNVSGTNPGLCVRKNNNGTVTTLMEAPGGACATANGAYGAAALDPEAKAAGSALTYPSVTIDITYTFTPFFLGGNVLGLPLTILPTTIHRRTVMRVL